jgi:DeoR family transcriptional regulator, fructose operon transcriptional repressor
MGTDSLPFGHRNNKEDRTRVEQPLPAERHRRIEGILRERRVVRVSSLSEQIGVSEVTIRRDLEALERRGVLERTHGGAVLTLRMRAEPAYVEAVSSNPEAKRRIAHVAADLVEAGDTLYMNGGTTTLQVFRRLRAPGLKVITNHVGIAVESAEHDLDLLLVGGHYRAPSNSVVGPFATEALRRTHATCAYVGVEGVSVTSGLTSPVPAEAEIARVMIEQARRRVVVVADHSKIGTVADFVIAPLDAVDTLVVDDAIDEEYRDRLVEAGVEVIVARAMVGSGSRNG